MISSSTLFLPKIQRRLTQSEKPQQNSVTPDEGHIKDSMWATSNQNTCSGKHSERGNWQRNCVSKTQYYSMKLHALCICTLQTPQTHMNISTYVHKIDSVLLVLCKEREEQQESKIHARYYKLYDMNIMFLQNEQGKNQTSACQKQSCQPEVTLLS